MPRLDHSDGNLMSFHLPPLLHSKKILSSVKMELSSATTGSISTRSMPEMEIKFGNSMAQADCLSSMSQISMAYHSPGRYVRWIKQLRAVSGILPTIFLRERQNLHARIIHSFLVTIKD